MRPVPPHQFARGIDKAHEEYEILIQDDFEQIHALELLQALK